MKAVFVSATLIGNHGIPFRFKGQIVHNPFTDKLVFDNDEGQFDVNKFLIKSIKFIPEA